MDNEKAPAMSPLSRTFTRDGWTLEIEIYEDGEGKWLLEVVDERNTSTVWTEPFETEQLALDEALRAIEEEGIEGFSESLPYRDN
jgi:hypothetical protein